MQVLVSLPDALVIAMMDCARANGRSLDDQILESLSEATTAARAALASTSQPVTLNLEETLTLALTRAAARAQGDRFEFAHLFLSPEWSAVANTRAAGRSFRKRAEKLGLVSLIGRSVSRHAIYQRR
jgi:hypothetical protein